MSNKVIRDLGVLHPLLKQAHHKIQQLVIDEYNMPIRLFETGRTQDRHAVMLKKGRETSFISPQVFNLENDPPLYATGLSYVYFDKRWSWNLRDACVMSWYLLFGNLVLDSCPEIRWGGVRRKNINYTFFYLSEDVVFENIKKYPCVTL